MLLTASEKKQIIELISKLNLKTQIIIGISGINLHDSLEWMSFCNDKPITGYMITSPIYTKPGIKGQTKWFECLLDNSAYPAMLYNIPGRAATRLYIETVENLKLHPKFVAIKDSSGGVDSLIGYKLAAPNIAVYCDDDMLMPIMAIEGASGLVSVGSNAWPRATRIYVEHSLKGIKIDSKIIWQAYKALFAASNPIPIKALMKDIGLITNDDIRLPLSIDDLPSRETLLKFHHEIVNWGINKNA